MVFGAEAYLGVLGHDYENAGPVRHAYSGIMKSLVYFPVRQTSPSFVYPPTNYQDFFLIVRRTWVEAERLTREMVHVSCSLSNTVIRDVFVGGENDEWAMIWILSSEFPGSTQIWIKGGGWKLCPGIWGSDGYRIIFTQSHQFMTEPLPETLFFCGTKLQRHFHGHLHARECCQLCGERVCTADIY